jgi:quercetin dioxygenase-like cupin family protein
MAIHRRDDERPFALHGSHIAGLATPGRGAAQVEVWRSTVEAGSCTPPHRHDTEEVVVVLRGTGRATIDDVEVRYQPGDTLILPAGRLHQIFADTDGEYLAAMPLGSSITAPDGAVMDLPWRG